ncbi:MAG: DciA family protein [Acidobacteriota bacterium]
MSDVVARLVRPAPLSAEKVLFAWRMAVGTALSRVTLVRLRNDGCLIVSLQDERWRPELERASALVRERMTATLGADVLRDVRLVGGPEEANRRPARARAAPRRRTPGPPAPAGASARHERTAPATRKRRPR